MNEITLDLLEKVFYRIAKKWIAGLSIYDIVNETIATNHKGRKAIINYLGEEVTSNTIIQNTVNEYKEIISWISKKELDACLSIKPSQLGMTISYKLCFNNFSEIINSAKRANGIFIWIDMENYPFVEDTIILYLDLYKSYQNLGVAIQSYLKRSKSDLIHLLEFNPKIRLVKGAYSESDQLSFQSKVEINQNFIHLFQQMVPSLENDLFLAIATHDPLLVNRIVDILNQQDLKKEKIEFQFLYGIGENIKNQIKTHGYATSEYIPYGRFWLPYSLRRLRERKRNIFLLARSLISQ